MVGMLDFIITSWRKTKAGTNALRFYARNRSMLNVVKLKVYLLFPEKENTKN